MTRMKDLVALNLYQKPDGLMNVLQILLKNMHRCLSYIKLTGCYIHLLWLLQLESPVLTLL